MEQYSGLIEYYIKGELSGQDLTDFEAAMAADPALQEAVREYRDMVLRLDGIRLRAAVKKNMIPPKPAGRPGGTMMLILVLMLAIGVAYWWLVPTSDEPPSPANTPPVLQQPSVPMANQPTPDTPVPSPKTPVLPKEKETAITEDSKTLLAYQDAVGKLSTVDVTTMGDGEKDAAAEKALNEAIRLLRNKKPYQAMPLIQQVLQQKNPLYQEDAEWLQALAWLLRDPAKGKQLLEQIEQKPTHAYRRNAIRLLGQL